MKKTNKILAYNNSCVLIMLSQSRNLEVLKNWLSILPTNIYGTYLTYKTKRFTLLRSPLGNKTAKDQFEFRKYANLIEIHGDKIGDALLFLDLIQKPVGINIKLTLKIIEKNKIFF